MQLPYELFPQHAEAKQAGFSPRTVEAVHVVQPSEDQSFPAAAAANQAPGGGWVPPYIAGAREASGASSHASRRGPQRPCEPKAQKLHLGGGGGSVEGSWEHVDAQRYDERDVVKVEESLPYKDEVDWTEQGALHRLGLAAQVAVPWRQRRRLAVWREQESLMQQLLLHARPVAERGRASGSGGPPATSAAIPSSIPPQNQSACDTTLRQSYRCRKPLVEPEVASQTDAAGSFEGALSLSPTSPRGPANSDLPWGSVMAPKANLGDGTGTSPATVRPRLPVQRKPLQPPQRLQPPPQTWRPPGLSELPQPHPHYQQAQCGLQKRQHQQPHQGNGFVLSRSVLSSLLLAGAAAARRQRGNAALVYGSGSYPPAHKDFREEVVPTGLSAVRQLTASYGDGVDDRESEEVAAIRKAEAAGSISAAVSARGEYDSVKYDSAAAAAPSSGAAAGVAPAASRQPTDVGHRGATLAAAAAAAGGCGGGDGGGVYINTSGDCHGRTGTTTVGQSVAPPTEGHGRMAVQEKYGYGSDDVQCVITYEKPDKVPGHARMLKLLQQQQQQQQQHDLMVTRREMQKNRHYELASYITDLGCDDGTGLPGGAAREAQRQSLAGGSLIAVSRQHGATATTTVRATAIAHIAIGQQTQTEAVQKTSAESGGKPLLPPPAMVAAAAKVAAASSLRQPYIHLKATTPATPHHANAAAIRGTSGSITTGARRSESVGASPAPTIVRETGTGGLLSGPGAAATVAEGSPRAAQASPEASFRICPAENDSPFAAREAAVIATAAVAPATAVRNGPRRGHLERSEDTSSPDDAAAAGVNIPAAATEADLFAAAEALLLFKDPLCRGGRDLPGGGGAAATTVAAAGVGVEERPEGVACDSKPVRVRKRRRMSGTPAAEAAQGLPADAATGVRKPEDMHTHLAPRSRQPTKEQQVTDGCGASELGSGQRPGSGSGQRPGSGSGQRPGSGSGQRPGSGSGQRPGSESGQRPGSESGQRPGSESGQRPGSGSGRAKRNKGAVAGADAGEPPLRPRRSPGGGGGGGSSIQIIDRSSNRAAAATATATTITAAATAAPAAVAAVAPRCVDAATAVASFDHGDPPMTKDGQWAGASSLPPPQQRHLLQHHAVLTIPKSPTGNLNEEALVNDYRRGEMWRRYPSDQRAALVGPGRAPPVNVATRLLHQNPQHSEPPVRTLIPSIWFAEQAGSQATDQQKVLINKSLSHQLLLQQQQQQQQLQPDRQEGEWPQQQQQQQQPHHHQQQQQQPRRQHRQLLQAAQAQNQMRDQHGPPLVPPVSPESNYTQQLRQMDQQQQQQQQAEWRSEKCGPHAHMPQQHAHQPKQPQQMASQQEPGSLRADQQQFQIQIPKQRHGQPQREQRQLRHADHQQQQQVMQQQEQEQDYGEHVERERQQEQVQPSRILPSPRSSTLPHAKMRHLAGAHTDSIFRMPEEQQGLPRNSSGGVSRGQLEGAAALPRRGAPGSAGPSPRPHPHSAPEPHTMQSHANMSLNINPASMMDCPGMRAPLDRTQLSAQAVDSRAALRADRRGEEWEWTSGTATAGGKGAGAGAGLPAVDLVQWWRATDDQTETAAAAATAATAAPQSDADAEVRELEQQLLRMLQQQQQQQQPHRQLPSAGLLRELIDRDAVGFDRMDAIMGPGQPEPPATGSRLHSNVTGQIDIPGQQQQQEDHHYHHYHHQQQHQQQPKQQQEKQRQGEVQEFARQRLRAALRGTPPSSQPVLSGAYPDCSGIGPDAGVAGAGVGTEPPFGRSADGEQQLGTHVRWGASSGGAAAGPWDAAEPRLERSSRKQRRQEDTEPRVEEEEEEQRRRRKPWQHQHQPQEQHRGLLQRGQPQLQRALGDPEEQPLQQQQPAHHHRNRYHHNHHRHHLPLGFKDDVRSEAMAAPTWSAARPVNGGPNGSGGCANSGSGGSAGFVIRSGSHSAVDVEPGQPQQQQQQPATAHRTSGGAVAGRDGDASAASKLLRDEHSQQQQQQQQQQPQPQPQQQQALSEMCGAPTHAAAARQAMQGGLGGDTLRPDSGSTQGVGPSFAAGGVDATAGRGSGVGGDAGNSTAAAAGKGSAGAAAAVEVGAGSGGSGSAAGESTDTHITSGPPPTTAPSPLPGGALAATAAAAAAAAVGAVGECPVPPQPRQRGGTAGTVTTQQQQQRRRRQRGTRSVGVLRSEHAAIKDGDGDCEGDDDAGAVRDEEEEGGCEAPREGCSGGGGAAAAANAPAVQRGAGGDIRLEDLRKTFNMPAPQAAMALGTSTTNLKRKCRQLGILRWPHRKLDSLNRLRSLVLSDVVEKSQRQALLDSIARNIQQIHQDPNSGLVPSLKNLRQAYYKRGFDVRARRGGSLVAGTTDSDNCSA